MMRWKAANNRNPVVLLRPIELRPLPARSTTEAAHRMMK